MRKHRLQWLIWAMWGYCLLVDLCNGALTVEHLLAAVLGGDHETTPLTPSTVFNQSLTGNRVLDAARENFRSEETDSTSSFSSINSTNSQAQEQNSGDLGQRQLLATPSLDTKNSANITPLLDLPDITKMTSIESTALSSQQTNDGTRSLKVDNDHLSKTSDTTPEVQLLSTTKSGGLSESSVVIPEQTSSLIEKVKASESSRSDQFCSKMPLLIYISKLIPLVTSSATDQSSAEISDTSPPVEQEQSKVDRTAINSSTDSAPVPLANITAHNVLLATSSESKDNKTLQDGGGVLVSKNTVNHTRHSKSSAGKVSPGSSSAQAPAKTAHAPVINSALLFGGAGFILLFFGAVLYFCCCRNPRKMQKSLRDDSSHELEDGAFEIKLDLPIKPECNPVRVHETSERARNSTDPRRKPSFAEPARSTRSVRSRASFRSFPSRHNSHHNYTVPSRRGSEESFGDKGYTDRIDYIDHGDYQDQYGRDRQRKSKPRY
ncbi:hypothetical protein DFH28DRAFT_1163078 [Melampsora americana]|nr:hypothetical protein DFH28DRAFT_1163078 [Melampsora americana]